MNSRGRCRPISYCQAATSPTTHGGRGSALLRRPGQHRRCSKTTPALLDVMLGASRCLQNLTKCLVTSPLQVASSSEKKCSAVRTHTRSPAKGHTPPELRTLRCAQGHAEHQLHQEPGGEDDLQAVHLRCPRGALQGHAVGVPGAAGLPKALLSGARHESIGMEGQEDGVGEDHEGGEDLTLHSILSSAADYMNVKSLDIQCKSSPKAHLHQLLQRIPPFLPTAPIAQTAPPST